MNTGFPSCRHVLAAVGFFAFMNFYALRVNLSVTIIAMVNSTYLRQLGAAAANVSINSSSDLEPCAFDHSTHDDDDNVRNRVFTRCSKCIEYTRSRYLL